MDSGHCDLSIVQRFDLGRDALLLTRVAPAH